MRPLVPQLSPGHRNRPRFLSNIFYFCSVKVITPLIGFYQNLQPIMADGGFEGGLGFKTVKLGMVVVATSFTEQDFLGQEPFPPKGYQSF